MRTRFRPGASTLPLPPGVRFETLQRWLHEGFPRHRVRVVRARRMHPYLEVQKGLTVVTVHPNPETRTLEVGWGRLGCLTDVLTLGLAGVVNRVTQLGRAQEVEAFLRERLDAERLDAERPGGGATRP